MADRTMKITEGDNSTTLECDGVDVSREGKEWFFDTDAGRVFLSMLLEPYEGERVNIKLSIEFMKPPVTDPKGKKL